MSTQISALRCTNDSLCSYPEPHRHGFACDADCPCGNGNHPAPAARHLRRRRGLLDRLAYFLIVGRK